MKDHRIIKRVLLALAFTFFLVSYLFTAAASQSNQREISSKTSKAPHFIAYYFYTSKRCSSCYRLENWSKKAIRDHFQQAMQEDKLEWKAIKVDNPGNKHFINDFDLYTKSLVVVEKIGNKTVRWKNLEKVWQLLRDKDRYFDYVTSEIQKFMENS